jgi:hypothetical protein
MLKAVHLHSLLKCSDYSELMISVYEQQFRKNWFSFDLKQEEKEKDF